MGVLLSYVPLNFSCLVPTLIIGVAKVWFHILEVWFMGVVLCPWGTCPHTTTSRWYYVRPHPT